MKRYKLLKDLFDHKAGEIITENDPVYSRIISEDTEQNFPLNRVELDLYTRLGVLEEVDENVRWKPKNKESYWYVTSCGELECVIWKDDEFDNDVYDFGNCFRTKEEAEAFRQKIIDLQK